jgi:hypothetical protein
MIVEALIAIAPTLIGMVTRELSGRHFVAG